MSESERDRRISVHAIFVLRLAQRPILFPNLRPFREDMLIRAALIGERLRDPEFVADYAAGSILSTVINRLMVFVG